MGDGILNTRDGWLATAERDFHCASIDVVFVRWPETREIRLIVGWTELFAAGLSPKPERRGGPDDSHTGGRVELHVCRVRCTVREALAWYAAAAAGVAGIPGKPDGGLTDTARVERAHEPPWPHVLLGEEMGAEFSVRFVGRQPGGQRTAHLVPVEAMPLPADVVKSRAAREWLRATLEFDLERRPHLVGSVHLVLTNPWVRAVSARPIGGASPRLAFSVQAAPEATLDGTELVIEEYRPYGLGFSVRAPASEQEQVVDVPWFPEAAMTSVYRHGKLVYREGVSDFLRGMFMMAHGPGPTRVVEVPEGGGQPAERVEVVTGPSLPAQISYPDDERALHMTRLDQQAQEGLRMAHKLKQHWYPPPTSAEAAASEAMRATKTVREAIAQARREVCIVDPYCGARELLSFVFTMPHAAIPVRVLAAKEKVARTESDLDALRTAVERGRSTTPPVKLEMRLMTGPRPPVHDRFLIVDDDVWHIGASLNALGTAGALVMKIPDPAPVRRDLMSLFHSRGRRVVSLIKEPSPSALAGELVRVAPEVAEALVDEAFGPAASWPSELIQYRLTSDFQALWKQEVGQWLAAARDYGFFDKTMKVVNTHKRKTKKQHQGATGIDPNDARHLGIHQALAIATTVHYLTGTGWEFLAFEPVTGGDVDIDASLRAPGGAVVELQVKRSDRPGRVVEHQLVDGEWDEDVLKALDHGACQLRRVPVAPAFVVMLTNRMSSLAYRPHPLVHHVYGSTSSDAAGVALDGRGRFFTAEWAHVAGVILLDLLIGEETKYTCTVLLNPTAKAPGREEWFPRARVAEILDGVVIWHRGEPGVPHDLPDGAVVRERLDS